MDEYWDEQLIKEHEKDLAEQEEERKKHAIPEKDQIWHLDYDEDGDESGPYGTDIYAGTITLYGPGYGYDENDSYTINVNDEDDAKYLVEKLNQLIEIDKKLKAALAWKASSTPNQF